MSRQTPTTSRSWLSTPGLRILKDQLIEDRLWWTRFIDEMMMSMMYVKMIEMMNVVMTIKDDDDSFETIQVGFWRREFTLTWPGLYFHHHHHHCCHRHQHWNCFVQACVFHLFRDVLHLDKMFRDVFHPNKMFRHVFHPDKIRPRRQQSDSHLPQRIVAKKSANFTKFFKILIFQIQENVASAGSNTFCNYLTASLTYIVFVHDPEFFLYTYNPQARTFSSHSCNIY